MTSFIEAVILGAEKDTGEVRAQIEPLLGKDETIQFVTKGDSGGAVFTDRRLLIAADAGIINKRSAIYSIRRADIAAFKIDVSSYTEVTLRGPGFGEASLMFDADIDQLKLAAWFGG